MSRLSQIIINQSALSAIIGQEEPVATEVSCLLAANDSLMLRDSFFIFYSLALCTRYDGQQS